MPVYSVFVEVAKFQMELAMKDQGVHGSCHMRNLTFIPPPAPAEPPSTHLKCCKSEVWYIFDKNKHTEIMIHCKYQAYRL